MMKFLNIKIWIAVTIFLGMIITSRVMTSSAQTAETSRYLDSCGDTSAYSDTENMTAAEAMDLYHENINRKFNEYIRTMISEESRAAISGVQNPDGNPPADGNCSSSNYSTYCVAKTLLSDPTIGYISYRKALDCRRGIVYENVEEKESAGTQAAALFSASRRLNAIQQEKGDAKRALDETLSAYNELRLAWPMHKKFMQIYETLIKFRDKMVEIRQQVEEMPAEFIDATTTKCT
jgi:hypothetical protein